jgi:hypothetical protein
MVTILGTIESFGSSFRPKAPPYPQNRDHGSREGTVVAGTFTNSEWSPNSVVISFRSVSRGRPEFALQFLKVSGGVGGVGGVRGLRRAVACQI